MHRSALWGALMGALAVLLGAFGAHVLSSALPSWGMDEAEASRRLDTWEIGVRYQMYHALVLVAIGCAASPARHRWLDRAVLCFLAGTGIFSGCLYALVLSGVKVLGAVVPVGGVLLIVGWALLAWGLRSESPES